MSVKIAKTKASGDISVGMAQSAVVAAPGTLRAVLGSCIGLCLIDPVARVAGMAHIVLPMSNGGSALPGKCADTAVPHLIELLQKEGAVISRVVAKIAGGASMFGSGGSAFMVGQQNQEAVLTILNARRICLIAQHVGGTKGRRVILQASSGQLTVEVAGQTAEIV